MNTEYRGSCHLPEIPDAVTESPAAHTSPGESREDAEMSRYPRAARGSVIKCIPCRAPVVATTGGQYVCVECGREPIRGTRGIALANPGRERNEER